MIDLIKSFFDALKNRIENPFMGSFVISCLLVNWDVFGVIFFSSEDFVDKVEIISTLILARSKFPFFPKFISVGFQHFVLLPSLLTVVYISILPGPSVILFNVYKFWEKEFKRVKYKFDSQGFVSQAEADVLLSENARLLVEKEESDKRILELQSLVARNDRKEALGVLTKVDSQESIWKSEYAEFIKRNYSTKFTAFAEAIMNGHTYVVNNNYTEFIPKYLAFNLIEKKNGQFSLTKKGEYFYKMFIEVLS